MEAALIIPVKGPIAKKIKQHRLFADPEFKCCPFSHLKLMSFVASEERIASLLPTIGFSCRFVNSFKVDINTWTREPSCYGYTVSMAPSHTKDLESVVKFMVHHFPNLSKGPQDFRPKIRVGECRSQEEYKNVFLSKFGRFSLDVNSISLVTKQNGVFKIRATFPLTSAVSKSNPSSATASSVSSECEDYSTAQTQYEAPLSNDDEDLPSKNEEKSVEKLSSKQSSKLSSQTALRPGKYLVKRKCRVRKSEAIESSFVKDLPSETVVKVTEIRNNRARIVEPVKGWISVTTKNKGQMLVEIVPPTVMYRKLPAGKYGLRNYSGRCKELETALKKAGLRPTKVILVRKRDHYGINIESFAFAEFKNHEEGVQALKTQIKLRDQAYRKEKKSLNSQFSPFSCVWSLKYKRWLQCKENQAFQMKCLGTHISI